MELQKGLTVHLQRAGSYLVVCLSLLIEWTLLEDRGHIFFVGVSLPKVQDSTCFLQKIRKRWGKGGRKSRRKERRKKKDKC